MKKSNTTVTEQGIEVYENDIYRLVDEYINTVLQVTPEEFDTQKEYKAVVADSFVDMIFYIHDRIPKPSNDDIELLDNIWNIYTNICYKFLLNPTILRFSIFVNINNNTIKDWINNRDRTNSIYSTTAKKWLSECECSLYDQAVNTNGIGAIFALKANYGYRDNYVINVTEDSKQEKTVEEIAADYTNQLPDTDNKIDF